MEQANHITFISDRDVYVLCSKEGIQIEITSKQMSNLYQFVNSIKGIDYFYDHRGNKIVQLRKELDPITSRERK